jgi:hypothetical protein
MIISHQHKFIFISNGKTGSTSLETALKKYDESVDFNNGAEGLWVNKHMPSVVCKAFLPSEVWRTYFKVTFVRNPFDWVVSQWFFNFKKLRTPYWAMIRRPHLSMYYYRKVKNWNFLANKKVLNVEDIDYLYNYLKQFRALPLAPSYLQCNYVFDIDGNKLVDHIAKFENFNQEVSLISKKIGIEITTKHLNKSKRTTFDNVLTKEAGKRIQELWHTDFETFNYEKIY